MQQILKALFASTRATSREHICFVADICGDHDFLGYWRSPTDLPISDSPIVWLDSESTFRLFDEKSFAMAVLYHYDFAEPDLRRIYEQSGIAIDPTPRNFDGITAEQYFEQRLELHINSFRN